MVDIDAMGKGKKVTCSVCQHSWWQSTERLQVSGGARERGGLVPHRRFMEPSAAGRNAPVELIKFMQLSPRYHRPAMLLSQTLRDGFTMKEFPDDQIEAVKKNLSEGREARSGPPKKKGAITLFCGNLPFTYVDNDIIELFKPHGEVASVSLVRAPDGRSRGFCFVDFVKKEDGEWWACGSVGALGDFRRMVLSSRSHDRRGQPPAPTLTSFAPAPTGEKAMEEMNGYELDGRSLNVALGGSKN